LILPRQTLRKRSAAAPATLPEIRKSCPLPRRLLTLSPNLLAALAFALAGVVMLGVSFAVALVIETRSAHVVTARMAEAGMAWATVETDGLQVRLSGTAPDEAARFRALNLAGKLVDTSRIRDRLDVAPANALAPPRFAVEMLRNDDGIQLIGLFPEDPAEGGLTEADLTEAANRLVPASDVVNMLQKAAYAPPATWDAALRFGLEALKTLKRSKISVMADRVEITAIADSASEKRSLETALGRLAPEGVTLVMEISAPRPVLTPFTLRFLIDSDGARFDACSADTEKARATILAAGSAAGAGGSVNCTIGLGTPTPRWAEAAAAGIRAVVAMGAGSVTFSDADVTLTAGEGVSQADFDLAAGDLRAALPDVFSLDAIAPRAEAGQQGPAEFAASLSAEGRVALRGKLVDERQQAAVEAYARAAFGAEAVYSAARLDPDLPDGWPGRVLAGLAALAELHDGSLVVRADTVTVKGVTGAQEAKGRITQILSSRLGKGADFTVDVRYDEELDPLAALPTPQECAVAVREVMAGRKITFTPGSAEIAPEAGPVIDALARALTDCPALPMEIAGHTDAQGSEGGNLALSQARAEAVLIALQGRRVDVSAMWAKGYGEGIPIADNGTEEGREANRRIEFVLKSETYAGETRDADDAAQAAAEAAEGTEGGGAAAVAEGAAVAAEPEADQSPSRAPQEKTIRPMPRPDRDAG
jgi:OOP family OmpA-OmpF porin